MTDTAVAEATESDEAVETPAATAGPEHAKLLTKEPSGLHKHLFQWLREKTGFSPVNMSQAECEKLIQLAVSLYQQYQKSDENKQRRAEENENKAAEAEKAKAAKAAEKAEKAAKKAAEEASKKAEKEAAGDDSEESEGETATSRRKPPARKSAAKAAAGEAPF